MKNIHWFTAIILCFAFATFGLRGISDQSLVDEPLWLYDRVEQYWQNIFEGDWKNVRPSDKPGVTTAILSAYGLSVHPRPSEVKDTATPELRRDIAGAMRFPTIMALGFLLMVFYALLRLLTGNFIALTALALTALSPPLIGISRIINPDATLWLLIPTTILAYAVLLTTHARHKHHLLYLFLTGILFGLCLLTKYVSNILFLFLPLIALLQSIFSTSQIEKLRLSLQKSLKDLGLITLIAIGTYIILLPSVWVKPIQILKGTFLSQAFEPIWHVYLILLFAAIVDVFFLRHSFITRAIALLQRHKNLFLPTTSLLVALSLFFVLITSHGLASFGNITNYELALQSPKSSGKNIGIIGTFFANFYVLLYGVTLLTVTGICLCFARVFHGRDARVIYAPWLLISFFILPFLYYAGSAVSGVATILRYQVALFPIAAIIAAYGFRWLLRSFSQGVQIAFIAGVAVLSISTLALVSPYYLSYANPLLPDGDVLNIKDMGDGSYQAATYLNGLPNAENLTIWSDKNGVCAAFVGRCTASLNAGMLAEEEYSFDYYVISRGRKHLSLRNVGRFHNRENAPEIVYHFDRLYLDQAPILWSVNPGNNTANYVRIISADNYDIFDINESLIK